MPAGRRRCRGACAAVLSARGVLWRRAAGAGSAPWRSACPSSSASSSPPSKELPWGWGVGGTACEPSPPLRGGGWLPPPLRAAGDGERGTGRRGAAVPEGAPVSLRSVFPSGACEERGGAGWRCLLVLSAERNSFAFVSEGAYSPFRLAVLREGL